MSNPRFQNVYCLALFGGSRTLGGVEVFNSRLAGLVRGYGLKVYASQLNSHLMGRNRLLSGLNFLFSFMRGLVFLWFHRPQTVVVSAANFLDVMAAAGFAQLTGRRDIMLIAHFNASWSFWRSKMLLRLFQHASRRLRVFCIAQNQRTYFVNRAIKVEQQIFPNFINYRVKNWAYARTPYLPGSPLKAVYVGRIVPEKKVDVLAAFLAKVAHKAMPVELEVVGSCPPGHEHYILQYQTPYFRVTFQGPQPEAEVSLALHKAMLFCSFSASDTLPLNMLEAAAHDLPILTLQNAVTEDVQDLVGELLFVEVNEPAQMVREKIKDALASPYAKKYSGFVTKNEELVCCILGISRDRSSFMLLATEQ